MLHELRCAAPSCSLVLVLVTRMQFYAYEIARNRRGLNDWVYEKAQEEAKKEVRVVRSS